MTLPHTVPRPEGLHRPDDPPNTVISSGLVLRHSDGRWEIRGWHVEGPWPHHCVDRGVDLWFGYTLDELKAIASVPDKAGR
jgi:hypothetical protein